VQSAAQTAHRDTGNGRLKFGSNQTLQIIHRFRVLLNAKESNVPLEFFEVSNPQHKVSTLRVGKCTDCFQGLVDHLAADAFEF